MAALMVHSFVQIWNRKTGMSKSREAFIETVEGKKKVKLVVYFGTAEHTFQLSNNIKNVVFRSHGENENHLHLTFQNNDFLFAEGLSSTDAENLKTFLDRVHQNDLQSPMKPDKDGSIFASTTVQKANNKTSSHKMDEKSSSQSVEKGERNEIPDHKMSSFESKSSTSTCKESLRNRYGKRKKMLPSGSETNKNFLKGNISVRKKSKINPLRWVNHNKKELRLKGLKQNNKLECAPSFKISSTRDLYLDVTDILQTLSGKVYLMLLPKPNYRQDDPEWNKLENTFDSYPEKLWQGLPNLGNTCYMNAVLQSLFSIPSFADDLLSQGFPWGKIPLDAFSMCLAQQLVLRDIYNMKIKETLLVNIKNAISSTAERFSDDIQNDAHEFLGHCLDQLKENMRKLNTVSKTEIESEQGNSPQQLFAGSGATEMFICPVITNFEFELLFSIVCKACGHVVLKTEMNNYLSINLPQGANARPLSIQSSFDHFFEAENLEYKCEECSHRHSLAAHKFSRLPRVLIVHLKRYDFNDSWSLKKDGQEVIISKYLKLSSHCNETTKPPLPIGEDARLRNCKLLKAFQKINSELIHSLLPLTKLTSQSKDFLASHIRSDKGSKPQKCNTLYKGLRRRQQKDLGEHSKRNKIESTLVNPAHAAIIAKELLAVGLMMNLEKSSFSLKDIPTGSPDTYQEVPENPKLKKYDRASIFVDLKRMAETTEKFCKAKTSRILKLCQVPEDIQQCEKISVYEQALWLELLRSLSSKPDAQSYTKKRRRTTKLSCQGAKVNSLGNKDVLNMEKTEAAARKSKREAKVGDRHAYRLIGVISHLGKTPNSGHYITDAYDFERQVWFTYNDLQVSSIQEATMQKARLCTGYIFFYMHNETFEELLGREKNSQPHSTEAGETPQE